MKYFALFLVFLFVIAGCNNPVEVVEETHTDTIMMEIGDAPEGVRDVDTPDGPRRHFARMLISLKRFVGLNEEQWANVKEFGKTLAKDIHDIRVKVRKEEITREEARELLKESRETFVKSVTSVLTEEQKPKFRRWLLRFWYHKQQAGSNG